MLEMARDAKTEGQSDTVVCTETLCPPQGTGCLCDSLQLPAGSDMNIPDGPLQAARVQIRNSLTSRLGDRPGARSFPALKLRTPK